jgi:hypothetical protein
MTNANPIDIKDRIETATRLVRSKMENDQRTWALVTIGWLTDYLPARLACDYLFDLHKRKGHVNGIMDGMRRELLAECLDILELRHGKTLIDPLREAAKDRVEPTTK